LLAAAVQLNSQEKKEINLKKAEGFIDEAAKLGAKIVGLPEYFNFHGSEILENAEAIPGPTIDRLAVKARANAIYLHCGSIPEKGESEEKVYNTNVLLNPKGEIIAKYRKIHLFDISLEGQPAYKESATVQAGSEVIVVETDIDTIGLSICYDLRFPELYRRLVAGGAKIIFIPAAFTLYTGKDHWEVLIRARAIENQAYIIAPAQVGTYGGGTRACYGKSMIVDPWGTVLAKAPDKEGVIVADIDLEYLEKIRLELPSLANRATKMFPC
jgi:predicted amidohydrolase